MLKSTNNIFFTFLFLITFVLVYLSRSFQIDFIKNNPNLFYIFDEPIFTNPDAYFFLNNIKEQILSQNTFFEKLFTSDLLTGIFVFIYYQFENISLPEIVFIFSPYFVLICFFSTFLFFSILGKNSNLALLTSFAFVLSNIVVTRSSALYFDTDILNLFLFFLILYFFGKLYDDKISEKELLVYSLLIIFFNAIFIYHYPKEIFSLIFLFMMIVTFCVIENKILNKVSILILFSSTILVCFNGLENFFINLNEKHSIYTNSQVSNQMVNSPISETVGELKKYSIFEIEKFLFSKNLGGFCLFLSMVGISIFSYLNKRKIILFLPVFIFLYLTYKFGIRFIIYIIPYIYFGFFFLIYLFLNFINVLLKKKFSKIKNLFLILGIICSWNLSIASCHNFVSNNCNLKLSIEPYFDTEIVKGIVKFNNLEDEYNIITSLDYGYLIDYYTNSSFHTNPGHAFVENKYSIFFSETKITNSNLKDELGISNNHNNYLFLTKDFIEWWPTINNFYRKKEDEGSIILGFSCIKSDKLIMYCISKDGLKSQINLENGAVDGSRIIYKVITYNGENTKENIINKEGLLTIVYSPRSRSDNLFAIFPRKYDEKNFIKYFMYSKYDKHIRLIENNWPHYKILEIVE